MDIQKMTFEDGINYVTSMIKISFLGDVADVHRDRVRRGVSHTFMNGKPLYLNNKEIVKLQNAIVVIGTQLMNTNVTLEPQNEDDSPYCYGNDIVSKFKVLGKVIKLPFLFIDVIGRTERWQKMHLSDKNQPKYYNKFSQDDLEEINNGIHSIALRLLSVKLMYEEQGEV